MNQYSSQKHILIESLNGLTSYGIGELSGKSFLLPFKSIWSIF